MRPGLKARLKRPVLAALLRLGRALSGAFDRPPPRLDSIRRVLVVQLGGFGDVLRVFPVIEQLRGGLPQAEIALLTNDRSNVLALLPPASQPCELIHFPLGNGYRRKLSATLALRRRRFDLVVSPVRGDGMIECAVLALAAGARHRIGFDRDHAGFLYNTRVHFDLRRSIVAQNLELLADLGLPEVPATVRVELPADTSPVPGETPGPSRPDGPVICIHPWASSNPDFRAWPGERYADLVRELLRTRPATVVVLGGPDERDASRSLINEVGEVGEPGDADVVDLTGRTDLAGTARIIAAADVFVGNDSGLLHIAVALGTPTVAVFGATDARQVLAPDSNATIVQARDVPCRPCLRHEPLFDYHCPHRFACLARVEVSEVRRQVEALLDTQPRRMSPEVRAGAGA